MQQLFDLFEEIGLPYFRQGSMSDADYQPSFFTYWNIDTLNESFYDNKETRVVEYVQVGYYTNNVRTLYSQIDEFIKKAKEKGFVIAGKARDANADKDNFFGRICYLRIINKLEE